MNAISLSEFADRLNQIIPIITKEFSRQEFGDILKTKVTIPQLLVLNFLDLQGETRMKDLAGFMKVTTPAMTGIVDRLVRDKYTIRVYDPKDGRVIRVKITNRGQELLKKAKEQKRQAIIKVFGKLPGSDRKEYLRIFTQIKDILVNENSNLK